MTFFFSSYISNIEPNDCIEVLSHMSLIKYTKRIEKLHRLIKLGKSGNPNEFSRKMNFSKRNLLDNLRELKEMGAPIKYSKTEDKYYYLYNWEPFAGILIKD